MNSQIFEDYDRLCERVNWACLGMNNGNNNAQNKIILEEFREFDRKWGARIQDPELNERLAMARKFMNALANEIEKLYLANLVKVIAARNIWSATESRFKLLVQYTKVVRDASPEQRPEWENIYRECMGKEFDPEECYLRAEAAAEEAEANYRKIFTAFEIEWPERIDEKMRTRLEKPDEEYAAWQQSVIAQSKINEQTEP